MADTLTPSATGAATAPVAEATGITKRFGATVALREARISVAPGESHALVGRSVAENATLTATDQLGPYGTVLPPESGCSRSA